MSDTNVKVGIELVDKAAQRALGDLVDKSDKADKAFNKVGKSGSEAFDDVAKHIGKSLGVYDIFVGSLAANVAIKAFDAIKNSASALFQTFIVEGVEAAREQEDAIQALAVSMQTSGSYSDAAMKDFRAFALALQDTTKYSETSVLAQLSLAKAFGASNEQAKLITQASVDLAAATGKSLEEATRQVSKTLGGFAGELGEVNPRIKALTKEQLKAGDAAKVLIEQYGGSAQGQVKTFSGAIAQAQNQFKELQITIATLFTQNPVIIAGITAIGEAFRETTADINGNTESYKTLVGEGFLAIITGSKTVILAVDVMSRIVSAVVGGIATAFSGVLTAIYGIAAFAHEYGPKILGGFLEEQNKMFDVYKQTTLDSIAKVNDAVNGDTALRTLALKLDDIEVSAQNAFDSMSSGSDKGRDSLNKTTGSVITLTDEQKKLNQELLNFESTLAKAAGDAQEKFSILSQALDLQQGDMYLSTGAEEAYYDAKRALMEEFYQDQQAKIDQARTLDAEGEAKYANASLALQRKKTLEMDKINKEQSDNEKQRQQEKLQYTSQIFGNLASLMQTNSRELFEIGKAGAIASATVNTYEAITKTMTSVPYPFNIPLAAAQGIAGAVQVANIAGTSFGDKGGVSTSVSGGGGTIPNLNQQKLAGVKLDIAQGEQRQLGGDNTDTLKQELERLRAEKERLEKEIEIEQLKKEAGRFATGGVVPGSSFTGDRLTAKVNSGEMILTRSQQTKLLSSLDGSQSLDGGLEAKLDTLLQYLTGRDDRIVVNIGSRTVVDMLRGELAAGRSI